MFARIVFPVDVIDMDISISVKCAEGYCPAGHQAGQVYVFNICLPDELCPASFHAVFPYLCLLSHGKSLPWGESVDGCHVHCPDHRGFGYRILSNASGEPKE
jgi:uncharacterized repeat protein (TIGR04076 family)